MDSNIPVNHQGIDNIILRSGDIIVETFDVKLDASDLQDSFINSVRKELILRLEDMGIPTTLAEDSADRALDKIRIYAEFDLEVTIPEFEEDQ
jgi:hypothetical protein